MSKLSLICSWKTQLGVFVAVKTVCVFAVHPVKLPKETGLHMWGFCEYKILDEHFVFWMGFNRRNVPVSFHVSHYFSPLSPEHFVTLTFGIKAFFQCALFHLFLFVNCLDVSSPISLPLVSALQHLP